MQLGDLGRLNRWPSVAIGSDLWKNLESGVKALIELGWTQSDQRKVVPNLPFPCFMPASLPRILSKGP
jgi:hypothetical protein